MQTAIALESVGHSYRGEDWLLRNYTFSVSTGQVLAVLGPNGCGKTTLLNVLLGLLQPREGQATRGGPTAYVPQAFRPSFDYTVLDMVLMGRARRIGVFGEPSAKDRRDALLALGTLDIADLSGRPFSTLSSGQRQLALVARALVSQSRILLFDEPTSALDLAHQALVLRWMSNLARERDHTIIFSTHDANQAMAIADDCLLMFGGADYAIGPVAATLTADNLQRLFGVAVRIVDLEHEGRTVRSVVPVLQ